MHHPDGLGDSSKAPDLLPLPAQEQPALWEDGSAAAIAQLFFPALCLPAKAPTPAGCGDENSYPQRLLVQPGRVLALSTQGSQQMRTIMFVIPLSWAWAKAVGRTSLPALTSGDLLPEWWMWRKDSPEGESWKILKQSTSCSWETTPLFSHSKAIKKILSFLGSYLTLRYLPPQHSILQSCSKCRGAEVFLQNRGRDSLQKGYRVNVRHGWINKVGKSANKKEAIVISLCNVSLGGTLCMSSFVSVCHNSFTLCFCDWTP